jgi:protein CpxP
MTTPVLLLLALAAAPTFGMTPQNTPSSPVQRMVSQLNLTADQKAKIDPILADDSKQVRALKDSGLGADDQAKKKEEIRKTTDEKIKPILTDDQWKKLLDLRTEDATKKKGKKQ